MRILLLGLSICIALSTEATSQTSSRTASSNPADTYAYFKSTLAALHAGADDARIRRDDTFIPLTSCNDASALIGYDDSPDASVEKIANLAYDVLYMKEVIRVGGYPNSAWNSDVDEYERSNLADIRHFKSDLRRPPAAKVQLARKLNEIRRSSGGHYKKVQAEAEGCGAGEVQVKISTRPSAQRVQFINTIKYNLCTFQNLDPRSNACDLWVDYSMGNRDGALMAGKYKLRATWSDGTVVYRDLNVDSLSGNNGQYSFVIVKQ